MSKKIILSVIIIAAFLLFCTNENPLAVTETETGNLFGQVANANDSLIPNAYVYLYSKSVIDSFENTNGRAGNWTYRTTTNDTGYYSFDTINSGEYYLEIAYDTLLGSLQLITIVKNIPKEVNIVVSGLGTISGTIDSLLAVENPGYIWIKELNTLSPITVDGQFTIKYLPEFIYNFKVISKIDSTIISSIIDSQTITIEEDSLVDVVIKKSNNTKPIANAGLDQNVFVSDTVHLDGSASSDYDSDTLTYSWLIVSQPVGSTVMLLDSSSENGLFIPDLPGSYTIELIVNDGIENSMADTVVVSATIKNSKPIANSGTAQNMYTGDTLYLDGSGSSDIDNDTLSYSWSLLSIPDSSTNKLSDSIIVNPILVLDIPGEYLIELIVNDGEEDSDPDSLMIECKKKMPVNNFFWAINNGDIFWTDDGETWNTTNSNILLDNMTSLNGEFYAADFNNKLYHSLDGLKWTFKENVGSLINDIVITNDKIVAVGEESKVMVSTDGEIWMDTTFSDTSWNSNSIAFGNSKFVLVINRGDGVKSSLDGLVWNDVSFSTAPNPGPALDAVAFGNGQFVAVGPGRAIIKSTDGDNWTVVREGGLSMDEDLNKIIYDGSKFIAIGPSDRIGTSTDGSSWNFTSTGTGETLKEIAFGNLTYIIATESKMLVSKDLITWNETYSNGANEISFVE